jgi:hypothetical protein
MSRKGLIISITVLFLQNQKKTQITLKMLNDFEEGFEQHPVMGGYNRRRPFSTQNANDLHLHQQSIAVSNPFSQNRKYLFSEFQSIEMDLEKHRSIISSLLALDHNLLNEMEIRPRNIDSLTCSVQTLEQLWIYY